MNILVTGSNGQLGNQMRLLGATSNNNYIFTDITTPEGVQTKKLDITNQDDVCSMVKEERIDVVVNCAAYTNVDKAEDDEKTAELINATAVENLAIACREVGATLIHISTDYVFGGNKNNTPCGESEPVNPTGAYGRTKLHGEQAIQRVGCNSIIIRTAWLYSAFGNNFVKTMIRLTSERDMLKVVIDQVGTPTYAGDLADVIFKIIEQNLLTNAGIYHFSNEGVISWYDFAKEICELSGNICNIQPCRSVEFPSKVIRPSYSVLDKTKLKTTFSVEVTYWKESLRKCIDEFSK